MEEVDYFGVNRVCLREAQIRVTALSLLLKLSEAGATHVQHAASRTDSTTPLAFGSSGSGEIIGSAATRNPKRPST